MPRPETRSGAHMSAQDNQDNEYNKVPCGPPDCLREINEELWVSQPQSPGVQINTAQDKRPGKPQ